MKKSFLKIGIFAVSIGFVVSVTFLSVNATSDYPYFNGGYKSVSNKGAALTCETQNPYVADPEGFAGVAAWAMTCNPSGGHNYAQVGWCKSGGYSEPVYFYEYNSDVTNAFGHEEFATAESGSHNDFMVGSDSTTMYFKLNGTQLGTVPLSTLNWTPDEVQFFGETHDTNDQCPGSVSNPLTMGNAQYKTTSGSWVSAGVTEHHSLSTMDNNINTGDTTWEIWDTRY
jgi:hypothetical protein